MVERLSLTQQEVEKAIVYWLNNAIPGISDIPDDARITFATDPAFANVEFVVDTDE